MKESKNLYTPGYREVPVVENDPARFLLEPSKNEYREKEREISTKRKDLPPDHLTAMYWG